MKTKILVTIETPEDTITYRDGKATPLKPIDILERIRSALGLYLSGGDDWTGVAKKKIELVDE